MAAGVIIIFLLSLLLWPISDREGFFCRRKTWAGAWPWALLVHEVVKVPSLLSLSFLAGKRENLSCTATQNRSVTMEVPVPSQDIRTTIIS